MRFKVPRYIDYKAKIVGSINFQQILFLGGGALAVFLFYLTVRPFSMFFFVLLSLVAVGISATLAFVEIDGLPFPHYIQKFFIFLTSSKTYVWKKKNIPFRAVKEKSESKEEKESEEDDDDKRPKGKSRLRETLTRIETS